MTEKLVIMIALALGLATCIGGCKPAIEKSASTADPIPVALTAPTAAPTDGGKWATFCADQPRPACTLQPVEMCNRRPDGYCETGGATHIELLPTSAICVRKQDGPRLIGYVWECILDAHYDR